VIGHEKSKQVERFLVNRLGDLTETLLADVRQGEFDVPAALDAGAGVRILGDDVLVDVENIVGRRIPERVGRRRNITPNGPIGFSL